MGAKRYYHCNLSKYHLNPHCGHILMILFITPTNIQLFENETCHSYHNNITEPIGVKEKDFFSENFDKGICTAGALIRALRKHNDTQKVKEKETFEQNEKKRESGETIIDEPPYIVPVFLLNFFPYIPLKECSTKKMYNFLSRLRLERFGPPSIGLAELNKWTRENSVVPDDIDQPFVVHSESGFIQTYSSIPEFKDDEDDDGAFFDSQVSVTQDEPIKNFPIYFRFVVTTKRLFDNKRIFAKISLVRTAV